MIAEHEENRRAVPKEAEVKPLREILRRGEFEVGVFVGHERVAEVEVKVRLRGERVGERLFVNLRLGREVEMRVRLHGERERAAHRARRVKTALRIGGEFTRVAAAMEIFGVSKYIAVPIAAILVWILVLRGTYRQVEKIFLVACSFYLAYLFSAILAHPNWLLEIGRAHV